MLYHSDGPAALDVAERLRKKVEQCRVRHGDEVLHVTISVGVATFPNKAIDDSKTLIECADKALYRAKDNGRNRVEVY